MQRRTIMILLATALIVMVVLVWFLIQNKAEEVIRLSNGCGIEPSIVPGETGVKSIVVDGLDREYSLHLPADYDRNTTTSLVLAFHWYEGDAQRMETATKMSQHADEHGYVVVYPQSTSFDSGITLITSWNDLSCNVSSGPEGSTCSGGSGSKLPFPPECGEPRDCVWCTCYDDLAYVEKLLDELEDTLCIDLDRVYATGISNGGMFTHRLGCNMADRFAAIAPVAGTLAKGFNCAPGPYASISLMNIHGSRDRYVPADGSEGSDGLFFVSVNDVMNAWAGAESQSCDDTETPYSTSGDGSREFICTQRDNCATGTEVVSCSWVGDHMSSLTISKTFGNDVVWDFFDKNSKQR